MTIRDWITDGVVIALVYGVFKVVELLWSRHKATAETQNIEALSDKTEVETLALLRAQIFDMAKALKELRERVEALEEALGAKETELRRVKRENDDFKIAVRGWVKAVMKFFQDHNITGYPEPDPKLLDTGDNMKAVK